MTKPGPAPVLNDYLKAIETVDDLIGIYEAQASSLTEGLTATDYAGRRDLENSIAGSTETAERLRQVRTVLAASARRSRRSPRTPKD